MSAPRPLRCAIYTRVSSDQGLEQDFNSLDAQREACEAYVKSQVGEGWKLVPDRYDDGGFSGGSLERPALRKLLEDVKAAKVDIIVVYKVDRLTRSLADFAKLVELFEARKVSFVSVTQSFNTTSSMGRLTLNVLLSFAQFEREVTGERIRDKIAASKKKGLWMGGIVPFGYRAENRQLGIEPEEARLVQQIFARYQELKSLPGLINELAGQGVKTRVRTLSSGKTVGGIPFTTGPLHHLLRNRLYLGEINHKGKSYPAEHRPIIDQQTFDTVQALLSEQRSRNNARYEASEALLIRRIFDDRGNRMSPTAANKGSKRYRYYQSWVIAQGRKEEAGTVSRVPAHEVEQVVCQEVRKFVLDAGIKTPSDTEDHELVRSYLGRVMVRRNALELELRREPDEPSTEATETRRIAWVRPSPVRRREMLAPANITDQPVRPIRSEARTKLISGIARGRRWLDQLMDGTVSLTASIAAREGLSEKTVRSILSLAFLAPDIVQAAIDGRLPRGIGISQMTNLPSDWNEQRRTLLMAA